MCLNRLSSACSPIQPLHLWLLQFASTSTSDSDRWLNGRCIQSSDNPRNLIFSNASPFKFRLMGSNTQDEIVVDLQHSMEIAHPNVLHYYSVLEPSLEELERELPMVFDGQIRLGELLSRVVQQIYAELSELADTMPNMSDSARKRTLADWVVKTKKQVVKLYAVAKWSRDAHTIQKCMNITAFLMTQNQQFEDTMKGLNYAKESLDPARLRNHDLLTSLDVLTTGSYLRLPTCIKKMAIPPTPLTDAEVVKTLSDMEETIRYRLRMSEIFPVEMSQYRITDGRVHFTVPNLFRTSFCLRGSSKDDGWFFVHVEFLINISGDVTGLQEFPRTPTGVLKRHITDEADARLAFYLPFPSDQPTLPDAPPRPQLPQDVVDTPLIRVYNFLQMMSLSYQLEILWYQAQRMRTLGWADYLTIQMSPDRKNLKASYWIRPLPAPSQMPNRLRPKLPPLGGTVIISIVEAHRPAQSSSGPTRTPQKRAIARLQQKTKLGGAKPSDEVEGLRFTVRWEPTKGALGVVIPSEQLVLSTDVLQVDAGKLDFESMLHTVIQKHSEAILTTFRTQLQHSKVFSPPGVVSLILDGSTQALRVHLCGDEVLIITIDSRTGRLNLRDTGDLAAAGRGPRFVAFSERLNENPAFLMDALFRLRLSTIVDLAEQKSNYLGFQSYRRRNILKEEGHKLGPDVRGTLYIQLANFSNHYLVLVVTDERFQYALITTRILTESMYANMVLEDIAWLDISRIHEDPVVKANPDKTAARLGINRKEGHDQMVEGSSKHRFSGFNLDTQGLRELYSYCCARVSFINVERQFKLRGIPFTHVKPTSSAPLTPELTQMQSSLARSVPALCVQSKHILSGAPAAEAAMPNIRVIPLNWWSDEKAQVVTCVKLKYVQQPMGKTASGSAIIRPSKRIIYDSKEAIVSFLSENVNTCVDEFLEEWARVSKMVVIAREVAQMAKETKWHDVRLLSFDLQTVEFSYAHDYTVSISCQDQLSPTGGNFDLDFSRVPPQGAMGTDDLADTFNPHEDAEPFLRDLLRHGHGRLAPSLHRLVTLLRDTLPIVVELHAIRKEGRQKGRNLDIFAKSAGWYRLLYGDLKHALDFRLMTNQRVAILDASHSLFDVQIPDKVARTEPEIDELVLQSIPQFRDIVLNAARTRLAAGDLKMGKVAVIDVGVVCDATGVSMLTRSIHAQVLQKLEN